MWNILRMLSFRICESVTIQSLESSHFLLLATSCGGDSIEKLGQTVAQPRQVTELNNFRIVIDGRDS